MNNFEFLKNYKEFAGRIRYYTAETLLKELESTTDIEKKKLLMLRIVEDLVSSTEDLAMWLIAIHSRNDKNKKYQSEWERLLDKELQINEEQSRKILSSYARLKTVKGFLKKMDFPTITQLRRKLGNDEQGMIAAVEAVKFTIETAVKQRSDGSRILERFQNKIKHGMMVYSDIAKDSSWVRDFSVKLAGKSKRVSRKNRNFDIPVDQDKAERIVGTIKANSQGIEALINLLIIDYEYKIKSGKIKMQKKNKEKWLKEIELALQ